MKQLAILGAGVCGLAAAWHLAHAKASPWKVALLEAEPQPGGLARSLTVAGHVTDLGPHRIYTELPDVRDFLDDVAASDLVEVRRKSRMFLRGHWIEYPPKPAEVLEVLGPAAIAGAAASFAWHRLTAPPAAKRPDTFEALMADAFGPALYNLLVGPYAEKVWKLPASQLHGDIARVRVSAGGLDRMIRRALGAEKPDAGAVTATRTFHYLAGGVESLVRKLANGVTARGATIECNTRVTAIEPLANGRHRLRIESPDGTRTLEADAVISTLPLGELVDMLEPHAPDPDVVAARRELRFVDNTLICIVARRPAISDAHWLYFPQDNLVFNRAYEPKNFHASMGRPGETMLVLEVTTTPGHPLTTLGHDELVRQCLDGLERAGVLRRDEVIETLVHPIPNTYPIYDLPYRPRLERLLAWLDRFPTLISTGRQGLFLHNNMDHSIHMGFRAATHLLETPATPARAFYPEVRDFRLFRIVD